MSASVPVTFLHRRYTREGAPDPAFEQRLDGNLAYEGGAFLRWNLNDHVSRLVVFGSIDTAVAFVLPWISDGFAGVDNGDYYLLCPEWTCWAFDAIGLRATINIARKHGEHAPLTHPYGLPPTTRCSHCKCPGAYIGYTTVECVNIHCRHYTAKARQMVNSKYSPIGTMVEGIL